MSESPRQIIIRRLATGGEGTLGRLTTDTGWECSTLELPWFNNISKYSCIPEGEYKCVFGYSPARKESSYRLESPLGISSVKGRSGVLLHSGNYAGDVRDGLKSHVQGCILLGKNHAVLGGQLAVVSSRPIVKMFEGEMDWAPFILKIVCSDICGEMKVNNG